MKGDVELVKPDATVAKTTRIGDVVRLDETTTVMTVCIDLGHELLLHNLEPRGYPFVGMFQDPANPSCGFPEGPLQ
jgi:hypothetical protein